MRSFWFGIPFAWLSFKQTVLRSCRGTKGVFKICPPCENKCLMPTTSFQKPSTSLLRSFIQHSWKLSTHNCFVNFPSCLVKNTKRIIKPRRDGSILQQNRHYLVIKYYGINFQRKVPRSARLSSVCCKYVRENLFFIENCMESTVIGRESGWTDVGHFLTTIVNDVNFLHDTSFIILTLTTFL